MALTEAERAYLATQRLGRLATLARDGTLQNSAVGVHYNDELGTIEVYRTWATAGSSPTSRPPGRSRSSSMTSPLSIERSPSVDSWSKDSP
jgi:hypothetical protein